VDTQSYKTKSVKKEDVNKEWIVIDAEGEPVGRLASRVAKILRGKHKPSFTPHIDCGDYVIVINADKVKFTGNKMVQKQYVRYTGYPGGKRVNTPQDLIRTFPERVVEKAVKGMIPRNRLGRQIMNHLFVYSGSDHPHKAQKPKSIDIKTIK